MCKLWSEADILIYKNMLEQSYLLKKTVNKYTLVPPALQGHVGYLFLIAIAQGEASGQVLGAA